jgi:hypothetical protein
MDKTVHGAGIQNRRFCYCYRNKKHFTGQVQISPVKYYLKWGGYQPIQPKTITLNELVNHPAELVRVNTTFPKPGYYIFGNSSVNTDASGKAQLRFTWAYRISQPENCGEIVGVVSNFYNSTILPRMDFPFAIDNKQRIQWIEEKTLVFRCWKLMESNAPAQQNPIQMHFKKEAERAASRWWYTLLKKFRWHLICPK